MAIKSLFGELENEAPDFTAIQIRTANPSTPVANQLWINKTTGSLQYFDTAVKDIYKTFSENTSYPATVANVAALNIDWNAGTVFQKNNLSGAGTTTFTFSNVTEGKTIILQANATQLGGGTTLAFPVGTVFPAGTNLTMANGAGVVIKFTRTNGVTYGELVYTALLNPWPSGSQGNLTINNGQTVNIAAGTIADYNNVTINTGGTLNITGSANGVLILGIAGNFVCNGQVVGRYFGVGGSFSTTTPNGEAISHTITQANGGSGGGTTAPPWSRTTSGGAGTNGFGGGGGGGSVSTANGGNGGANNGNGNAGSNSTSFPANDMTNGTGGTGGATLGNGNNGTTGTGSSAGVGGNGGGSGGGGGARQLASGAFRNAGGGGGGGGYKGRHGLSIYIYCNGNVSGSGSILCNGLNGFAGGAGGNTYNVLQFASAPGGGGGGGAGGSGGRVWIRRKGTYSAITMNVSAGTGGSAGAAGTAAPNGSASNGGVGGNGTAGSTSVTLV